MTELVRFRPGKKLSTGKLVATLGTFDGIHRGHQALLHRVQSVALNSKDLSTALISFYPHPAVVLGRVTEIPQLTDLRQRLKILTEIGIDFLIVTHFTPEFSQHSARDFIADFLVSELDVEHLVIGPDAGVGHRREGSADFILEQLRSLGREGAIVSFLEHAGERVSSRRIRAAVAGGDIKTASLMLDRNFSLTGRVKRGAQRGRVIGFRTANLSVAGRQLPANGVYATRAILDGVSYPAVTNVGVRPTFSGEVSEVETHLLDYHGDDFYSSLLEVSFVDRLRPEKRFPDLDSLKAAIQCDVEKARVILG
ncbi:MAG: riboflavin biosynthesis protein RibF [Bdellovibrionales bacterium]|nr:riboflavin biosynthesis protein RibF [Bdellovibrionales bacterium]